jgi:hypothetical protein
MVMVVCTSNQQGEEDEAEGSQIKGSLGYTFAAGKVAQVVTAPA